MTMAIIVYIWASICFCLASSMTGNSVGFDRKLAVVLFFLFWWIIIPVAVCYSSIKLRESEKNAERLRSVLKNRPNCGLRHGSGSSWCDVCGGAWDYGDFDHCKQKED